MQIVSIGDNLHEVSKSFSKKNKKKDFNMSSAENLPRKLSLRVRKRLLQFYIITQEHTHSNGRVYLFLYCSVFLKGAPFWGISFYDQ